MLIHLSIMFLAVVCILLVVSVISLSKRLNNAARDLKNYADAAAKAECAKLRTRVESLEKGAVPDYEEALAAAKAVNDLGGRAKAGKLKPDDTQGGTYTVTNVGPFGSVFGTPIINQPQVGILALGAIRKMPAVIETPEGDFIGIRQKMFLSHSYDHRVVDGALGGSFVKRVAEYLEAFDVNRDL